ncbi:DNA translocase FtsK [Leclercia barmai]|uniref:DNA translocase FtsK n=1 Tax=Leclercia barmai TaxID=2785629 RepID=UPI003BB88469
MMDKFFDDPLFAQAIEWVVVNQKPSVSGLQRNLRIGFNRAEKLINWMEVIGIITPMSFNEETETFGRSVLVDTIEAAVLLKDTHCEAPDLSNVIPFPNRK